VVLKRRIGYLSGDFELYNNLTGSQYIKYMSHLSGVKNQSRTLELVEDLNAVMDRKIGLLSRGNKQKIGLIAALMNDPDILILDEPTTGLDPLMQQKFYKAVQCNKSFTKPCVTMQSEAKPCLCLRTSLVKYKKYVTT